MMTLVSGHSDLRHDSPVGAGGGRAEMFSLARAGEGGAGMLPAGPRGAGTDPRPRVPADLLLPSFFLLGRLMLTWRRSCNRKL